MSAYLVKKPDSLVPSASESCSLVPGRFTLLAMPVNSEFVMKIAPPKTHPIEMCFCASDEEVFSCYKTDSSPLLHLWCKVELCRRERINKE